MVRSPRWERRAADRPGEIVAAALGLFAERGFAATRLEDVARRAGVSKGTIYLYFESKEDLFRAIVRENVLPRIDGMERMIGAFQGRRADLLRSLIVDVGSMVATTPVGAVVKLILAESGNFPQVVAFYHDSVIRRGLANVARIIEDGIADGEFRPCDPESSAKLVIFPMIMTTLWNTAFRDVAPLDHTAFLEAHADTILRGLAAHPDGD